MGRRISALALAALLGLTASGCGGRDGPRQEPEPPAEVLPPAEETTDPAEESSGSEPTGLDAAEPPTDEEVEMEPGSDAWIVWEDAFLAGVAFLETEELDGLRYGQTEEDVEALWGAPGEKTEPEVWASDGRTHSQWRYDGAELSFADGTLENVRVTSPLPGRTAAGVGIGSTAEEVRAAYPELIAEESSTEELLVAGSVYAGLLFALEDGAVARVTLGVSGE